MLEMMSYELERAFGRILGLDYAQVNPGALTNGEVGGTLGWPVMQPLSGFCSATGGVCLPDPAVLRMDDHRRAQPHLSHHHRESLELSRQADHCRQHGLHSGHFHFRTGYGMQGVNVVARPLDSSGNPLDQYAVTAVSGALFSGDHGNPVTGFGLQHLWFCSSLRGWVNANHPILSSIIRAALLGGELSTLWKSSVKGSSRAI